MCECSLWLCGALLTAVVTVYVLSYLGKVVISERKRRQRSLANDSMLEAVLEESRSAIKDQPMLRGFLKPMLDATSFEEAVAIAVADRLAGRGVSRRELSQACLSAYFDKAHTEHGWPVTTCLRRDCEAVLDRDPATNSLIEVLLYYKGYSALAAHRVANWAWAHGDTHLALWLQSRVSEVCGVDIHPAAAIGAAVMMDHGTGVVVGETATIGDGCSILHGVTLGATGKEKGDRHPKIGKHVLIGAGSSILGNIRIGDGAKIGSGAVVLRSIPAGATAVGAPAKIIGRAKESRPAEDADQGLRNIVPNSSAETDIACVWRAISKHAEPRAKHIGIIAFSEALAQHGIDENDIGNLFFQLDQDNDGLVSLSDLKRFPETAMKFCKASCACPVKRAELSNALTAIIPGGANSASKSDALPQTKPIKTPSDMENANALVPPVA